MSFSRFGLHSWEQYASLDRTREIYSLFFTVTSTVDTVPFFSGPHPSSGYLQLAHSPFPFLTVKFSRLCSCKVIIIIIEDA